MSSSNPTPGNQGSNFTHDGYRIIRMEPEPLRVREQSEFPAAQIGMMPTAMPPQFSHLMSQGEFFGGGMPAAMLPQFPHLMPQGGFFGGGLPPMQVNAQPSLGRIDSTGLFVPHTVAPQPVSASVAGLAVEPVAEGQTLPPVQQMATTSEPLQPSTASAAAGSEDLEGGESQVLLWRQRGEGAPPSAGAFAAQKKKAVGASARRQKGAEGSEWWWDGDQHSKIVSSTRCTVMGFPGRGFSSQKFVISLSNQAKKELSYVTFRANKRCLAKGNKCEREFDISHYEQDGGQINVRIFFDMAKNPCVTIAGLDKEKNEVFRQTCLLSSEGLRKDRKGNIVVAIDDEALTNYKQTSSHAAASRPASVVRSARSQQVKLDPYDLGLNKAQVPRWTQLDTQTTPLSFQLSVSKLPPHTSLSDLKVQFQTSETLSLLADASGDRVRKNPVVTIPVKELINLAQTNSSQPIRVHTKGTGKTFSLCLSFGCQFPRGEKTPVELISDSFTVGAKRQSFVLTFSNPTSSENPNFTIKNIRK